MEEIKICKQCGKEITADGRKLFCSEDCQNIFYGKKEIKKTKTINISLGEIRQCKYCGKDFVVGAYQNQKYCNPKCKKKYHKSVEMEKNKNIRKAQRLSEPKICVHCGKEFFNIYVNKQYCSDECKTVANRIRIKEARKKKTEALALSSEKDKIMQ